MTSVTYLLFTLEQATRFLDLISSSFPDYHEKRTGRKLTATQLVRNTKYWKLTVGGFLSKENDAEGNPILTDGSILYKISLYVNSADISSSPFKAHLPSIIGIFKNLFPQDKQDPERFGKITKVPNPRGRKKKPEIAMPQETTKEEFNASEDTRMIELVGSQWSVYCWEEFPAPPAEIGELAYSDISYGVECNVIHFDEKGTTLYVRNQHGIDTYKGGYSITRTQWLLEIGPLTINAKGRNLRILTDIGDRGSLPELMLGVFYNSRQDHTLACGSALLVQRYGKEILSKERLGRGETLGFQSNRANLPRVVRHFFRNRGQNFIQLPKGGYSLSELEIVLNRLGKTRKAARYVDYKYDAFISVPLTSPGSDEIYATNRDLAQKLKKILADEFNVDYNRLYLACEDFNSLQKYNFKKSSDLFEETRQNLISSRFYIMLYPRLYNTTRISSAVTELGMAVGMGKIAVLFCSKEVHEKLPRNIVESRWVKVYELTSEIQVEDQLLSLVQSNKAHMFRLMLSSSE